MRYFKVFLTIFAFLLSSRLSLAATAVDFTPTSYTSTSEIINPARGMYRWRGDEYESRNAPSLDEYERYTWAQIETSDNVFDFSQIDADLNAAVSRGHKFAFRVRSMYKYGDSQIYVPSYLGTVPYGWWDDYNNDGTPDTFIPDWNNATVQSRMQRFIQKLGDRYNSNPNIVWIDIGMYGQWGEWSLDTCDTPGENNCIDYSAGTSQIPSLTQITQTNKNNIVNYYAAAFPNQQLVMAGFNHSIYDTLIHAFSITSTTYPIGWRTDCLGDASYFDQFTNRPSEWNNLKDRWQVAPVIGEYCGTYISPDAAQTQITTYHFSAIGNGNYASSQSSYNSKSQSYKDTIFLNGKSAGYKFVLTKVSTSTNLIPGSSYSLISYWQNTGVAPVYQTWRATWRLLDSNGNVAHSFVSNLNLKSTSLISTTPISTSDTLTLPSSISSGNYTLNLIITDPAGSRNPLRLAISGVKSDTSYDLGTITILGSSATSTPTSTPTFTPTPTQSATSTSTPAPTNTPNPGGIVGPTSTATPAATSTPNPWGIPGPTSTATPRPTVTPIYSNLPTQSALQTPTPTFFSLTPTAFLLPTIPPINSPTPTLSPQSVLPTPPPASSFTYSPYLSILIIFIICLMSGIIFIILLTRKPKKML